MTDFKDQMIEAIEREGIDPDAAYDHVREAQADDADQRRKNEKEEGPITEGPTGIAGLLSGRYV